MSSKIIVQFSIRSNRVIMRAFILLFIAACAALPSTTKRESALKFLTTLSGSPSYEDCNCHSNRDVTTEYLDSVFEFSTKAYRAVGLRSSFHFVFSPLAMWIILAAIAEGADPVHQHEIFKFLNLPDDICVRQEYYKIATSRIWPGDDVKVTDSRVLVIDEDLEINPKWYDFVKQNYLIDVVSAPIRRKPDVAISEMQKIVGGDLQSYNLTGNSVILDAVDYNGLWATTFHDAILERAPFYNQNGNRIGSVDLMRVKRKVRIAHMPDFNIKAIELPVGIGNRYRMVFGMILNDADVQAIVDLFRKTIVLEFLSLVEESHIALDLAIPRFTLNSEIDVRTILEDMGVVSPWSEAGATRFISTPPALPSSFVQRTTMTIDNQGLGPPELVPKSPAGASTGVHSSLGTNFIADRPFLFALFDSETYSILFASAYTQPTYSD